MKYLTTLFLIFTVYSVSAQIEDIKKSSKANKKTESNISTYSTDYSNDDVEADLLIDALGCCFENGFTLIAGLLAENHRMIMENRDADPTIISADFKMNFAPGWHYSKSQTYWYVDFLPEIAVNLAWFTTFFRYNILTEYTNDFPNSFTSWEWLFLFNVEPSPKFKLSLGTGVQYENYSDTYFNEHYIGLRFLMPNNQDFLETNTRFSIDYETGAIPFLEAGIHYKIKVAEFENIYMFINLAGVYQNYYSSHDIWLGEGGLIINWH